MSDGLLTAAAAVLNLIFLLAGVFIYLALVRQIAARGRDSDEAPERGFGLPDVFLALFLALLFLANAVAPGPHDPSKVLLKTNDLIFNALISAGLFVFISAFLAMRRLDVGSLAGFARIGIVRVVLTGAILLFFAYPLIWLADVLTRHFFGGADSRQAIVEMFNNSQTLQQRVLIIILATAVAPMVEEFVFRFYLYGVLRRYAGRFAGLLINAALFSAVHAHAPSAAPLFVLGSCFTLAYEWSGSILVPMSMHALFNGLTLVFLAFPELFPRMNLRELGEDALVQRITRGLPLSRAVLSAAGDDCAVVRFGKSDPLLLLKTDCVVQGIHFDSRAKAGDVGWKAMARPLSDFAAMSGLPQFALVTFIAPASTSVAWTDGVYRGIARAARAFAVAVVGGETSRTEGPVAISVSITGAVENKRCVLRSGGKAGDEIFVTGRLGGSIRGKHLRFTPRIGESRWLTSNFRIHAMMDLSDGLSADLPRLAKASDVGFELDEAAIPRTRGCTIEQAISDGEDYELLFAISANESNRLQKAWTKKFPKLPLTCIGRLIRKSKTENRKFPRGYVHFQ